MEKRAGNASSREGKGRCDGVLLITLWFASLSESFSFSPPNSCSPSSVLPSPCPQSSCHQCDAQPGLAFQGSMTKLPFQTLSRRVAAGFPAALVSACKPEIKREDCKSCSHAGAEQRWGRGVRPGCAGRAKALLSAAWSGGRGEHVGGSSFMSNCPRAGRAMAGMKFHCHSCQPDGQSSPLPPLEGVRRPSRMETSRTQRGEAALCLGVPSAAGAGFILSSYITGVGHNLSSLGYKVQRIRVFAFHVCPMDKEPRAQLLQVHHRLCNGHHCSVKAGPLFRHHQQISLSSCREHDQNL